MTNTTDDFLAKLEAFADTLSDDEQAILGHLLDDDEVSGFAVVSGPIPLPLANLRLKIDDFIAPGAGPFRSPDSAMGLKLGDTGRGGG